MRFEQVLSLFYSTAWAILPERLTELEMALLDRLEGGPKAADYPELAMPSRDKFYSREGSVAVVPISGTIYPRGGISAASGATTGEYIQNAVGAAAADKAVSAIVLDINSPGGAVFGTTEAADAIRSAAMAKPVHAVANHVAASGALWLGSQATTFSVAPNGQVGSVGVIYTHADYSAAMEKRGVKLTSVKTSPYKDEANPYAPISEAAISHRTATIQEYHRQFISALARGRGRTADWVEANFGQGRMLLPDQAVAVGMVDRIATLEEVIASSRESRAAKDRYSARARILETSLDKAVTTA